MHRGELPYLRPEGFDAVNEILEVAGPQMVVAVDGLGGAAALKGRKVGEVETKVKSIAGLLFDPLYWRLAIPSAPIWARIRLPSCAAS